MRTLNLTAAAAVLLMSQLPASAQGLPQACAKVPLITTANGPLHCGPGNCVSKLSVVADGQNCCVTVPYSKLIIHTQHGHKKPKVVWKLPNGYVFHGRDGIRLDPGVNQAFEYLKEPGHEGSDKKTFKWVSTGLSTAGPVPGGLPFLPVVYPDSHENESAFRCLAQDPVVVNTDN